MYLCYIYLVKNFSFKGGVPMKSRIRDLREDADLTQAELAARIGITQRKYSYIETETQPLTDEMLVKLADFYNVSVDYILLRTEKPELNA